MHHYLPFRQHTCPLNGDTVIRFDDGIVAAFSSSHHFSSCARHRRVRQSKEVAIVLLHPGFNRTDMTRKYAHIWDVEGAVTPEEGPLGRSEKHTSQRHDVVFLEAVLGDWAVLGCGVSVVGIAGFDGGVSDLYGLGLLRRC
jgi:hypothetical protein